MIQSFQTDRPGQTVQRSSLITVYNVWHSVCMFWTFYSMIKPHCSTFRKTTTIFVCVWNVRIFTVFGLEPTVVRKPTEVGVGKQAPWYLSFIIYSMVKPHCSTFRKTTAIVLFVWNVRIFTVFGLEPSGEKTYRGQGRETSCMVLIISSLVMPNSYPRDGIFNPHPTTIKDSNNLLAPVIFS